MGSLILFILAFLAFALSTVGLRAALVENIVLAKYLQPYSTTALKVGRIYKIVAWSILSMSLFIFAVQTFVSVFFAL